MQNEANVNTWMYYVERVLADEKEVAVVEWSARENLSVVLLWILSTRVRIWWQTLFFKVQIQFPYSIIKGNINAYDLIVGIHL